MSRYFEGRPANEDWFREHADDLDGYQPEPLPPPLPPPLPEEDERLPAAERNGSPTPECVSAAYRKAPAETNRIGSPEGSLTLPFALLTPDSDEAEEPGWTWDGYLAPGTVTAIGRWPKVGKTRLLWSLLAAVREGRPFLDRQTRQTGVLFLTEERKGTLASKLRMEPLSGVHHLRLDQANGVPWAEVVGQAVVYCERKRLGLLVVDTFPRWALIEDENAPGPVIQAIAPLDAAAATGLAVAILLHQRKARGRYGEAIRGSNALAAT